MNCIYKLKKIYRSNLSVPDSLVLDPVEFTSYRTMDKQTENLTDFEVQLDDISYEPIGIVELSNQNNHTCMKVEKVLKALDYVGRAIFFQNYFLVLTVVSDVQTAVKIDPNTFDQQTINQNEIGIPSCQYSSEDFVLKFQDYVYTSTGYRYNVSDCQNVSIHKKPVFATEDNIYFWQNEQENLVDINDNIVNTVNYNGFNFLYDGLTERIILQKFELPLFQTNKSIFMMFYQNSVVIVTRNLSQTTHVIALTKDQFLSYLNELNDF